MILGIDSKRTCAVDSIVNTPKVFESKGHILDNLVCLEVVYLPKLYFCVCCYSINDILCLAKSLPILVEQSNLAAPLCSK